MNNIINRRRVIGGSPKSLLPKEYRVLEYVNSAVTNPTCPVFSISVPFTVRLEVEPVSLSVSNAYGCFFGANSNLQLAYYSDGRPTNGATANNSYNYVENKKVLIEGGFSNASGSYYKVDGLDLSLGRKSTATMFAINGASVSLAGTMYPAQAKYYSCKVFKDGECIIDLYPCKRKANGVNGLYDVVNDVFYATNWLDE